MSHLLETAKASAKLAFRRMMDAATAAANVHMLMADEATDPEAASKCRHAAQKWQNVAQEAYRHWSGT